MASKLAIQRFSASTIALLVVAGAGVGAHADEPSRKVVANPSYVPSQGPVVLDFSPGADPSQAPRSAEYPPASSTFEELDDYILSENPNPPGARTEHALPEGLTQIGGMVVPVGMLDGADMVADVERALSVGNDPALGDPQEFCAFPDEVPNGVYDQDQRRGAETPRFHTVFLNYNGGVLTRGGENSAENMSNIAISNHEYPVYGGGTEKAIAVAQAVQADFEDWAVRVVYLERPPKVLPYTMVMIGGHYSDTTAGPSGGVAPLDCEDYGQRNVCYAFQNGEPVASQANVASQEIGHTLGLGHTSASDSVMAAGYASTQPGDLGFNDSCAPTINLQGQGASCVGVNKCHCGVGDQQHDKNTFFATFAPAGPDITPPTIAFVTPADESVYAPGETINIELDPWDDVGGYGWQFTVTNLDTGDEIATQIDYNRELLFNLVGLREGHYEIRALVQDHADQTGEAVVTLTIETPAADEGGDGADTGTGGGADDGAGSGGGMDAANDDSGDGSGGSGGDAGLDGGADGSVADDACNCRSTGSGAPIGLFALVGLLGLGRRRRPV